MFKISKLQTIPTINGFMIVNYLPFEFLYLLFASILKSIIRNV